MGTNAYKKALQRTHKERSQLDHRQKLGLLEKKKDFLKRAAFTKKQESLNKKAARAAALKNDDEYYKEMTELKLRDGVLYKPGQVLDAKFINSLKSQDLVALEDRHRVLQNRLSKIHSEALALDHEVIDWDKQMLFGSDDFTDNEEIIDNSSQKKKIEKEIEELDKLIAALKRHLFSQKKGSKYVDSEGNLCRKQQRLK